MQLDDTDMSQATSSNLIHYVADNVDHNIRKLDGMNTFHGMGIISATVRLPDGNFGSVTRQVRRTSNRLKAVEAIRQSS